MKLNGKKLKNFKFFNFFKKYFNSDFIFFEK